MHRLALGLAALFTMGAALSGGGARAQTPTPEQQLTVPERDALRPLHAAVEQRNRLAFQAALPAARAAVRSAYGRYLLGQLVFQMGLRAQDFETQVEGIEAMAASGAAPPDHLRPLLLNQTALALQAEAPERAEALLARLAEVAPADPQIVARLAEVKLRLARDPEHGGDAGRRQARKAEALALYQRALQLAEAAPQPQPESFYRRAAALAFDAGQGPLAATAGRQLVVRYPTPLNWRDALLLLRDLNPENPELALDIGRLMLRTGSLAGERDHLELARALLGAERAIEAKAVLDRGVAAGMLAASDAETRDLIARATRAAAAETRGLAARRTAALGAATGAEALAVADTLLAQGAAAEAAALYRAALEKGGVDADLVNSRLALALAEAGQRAEAEAALAAVSGPRQAWGAYLLAWLGQRSA